MDKQKIKNALSFEYVMYLIKFALLVVIGIISLVYAWIDENMRFFIISFVSLFFAYLDLKRALYLNKLEESI